MWFNDAKLGIMTTWGLYSVPGWAPLDTRLLDALAERFTEGSAGFQRYGNGPDPLVSTPYSEWYLNSMSVEGTPTARHHLEVHAGRPYDDFVQPFEAAVQRWQPDEWADLFALAGARYVVPVTKHHDGYLLWPSTATSPHRSSYAVRRDVVGELGKAVRARGLRYGLYYSGGLDWTFAGLPVHRLADVATSGPSGAEYAAYADRHWRELIERYRPDVLWNDISYPRDAGLAELVEYYRSQVPEGLVNDRFGDFPADFHTPEYADIGTAHISGKWELVRGVGLSFGYNQQETAEHTLSSDALVHLLLDVVSRGGNLLLGVGPTGAGTISPLQRESLLGLGRWLQRNGEAVYGTRQWTKPAGSTDTGVPVRFTAAGGTLFVTMLGTPDQQFSVHGLHVRNARVDVLGGGRVEVRGNGEVSRFHCQDLPDAPAHVLRVQPAPARLG